MSDNTLSSRNSITKKKKEKDRAAERRRKLDAQSSDIDIGHIVDEAQEEEEELLLDSERIDVERPIDMESGQQNVVDISFLTKNNNSNSVLLPLNLKDMPPPPHKSLDRSSSDQSTGSLLYCRTPSSNIIIGGTIGGGPSATMASSTINPTPNAALLKSTSTATSSSASSSIIFPTGVDGSASSRGGGVGGEMSALIDSSGSELSQLKRRKINLCLDQCESIRFPFKKKLILQNMKLTAADIPLNDLCGTSLGNTLHKLSLSGNNLGSVPPRLVQSLPLLRSLDLSRCELHQLPDRWNLPKLTRLNLSDNLFTDFPEEVRGRSLCGLLVSISISSTHVSSVLLIFFPFAEHVGRVVGVARVKYVWQQGC
jgi:Leucine-rich repeat (LRR) protein